MMPELQADVAVVGGGVSGLWLANALVKQGYAVCLLDAHDLGTGQSIASQGIVHDGRKYAEGTRKQDLTSSLKQCHRRWVEALKGDGEIDLRAVRRLSDGLSYFLSQRGDEQRPKFVSSSYEPVLDMRSLLDNLVKSLPRTCSVVQGYGTRWALDTSDEGVSSISVRLADRDLVIRAARYIFVAGSGNETVIERLVPRAGSAWVQRRPLYMQLIRAEGAPLFGHVVDEDGVAQLTITTHADVGGGSFWYVGGRLASTDFENDATAWRLVESVFPRATRRSDWLGSLRLIRYEAADPAGVLPTGPIVRQFGNSLIGWPTKFTLVPLLSDYLIKRVIAPPSRGMMMAYSDRATIARPPWIHGSSID